MKSSFRISRASFPSPTTATLTVHGHHFLNWIWTDLRFCILLLIHSLHCHLNMGLLTSLLGPGNLWTLWYLPNQGKLQYLRINILHYLFFLPIQSYFSPLTRSNQCWTFLLFRRYTIFLPLLDQIVPFAWNSSPFP